MPMLNQMFPSKYMNASDVEDGDITLTVKAVKQEMVGSGANASNKWVVQFRETDKRLIISKTHGAAIVKQLGDDSDFWTGQSLTFTLSTTSFGSETVPCVRIRPRPAAPKTAKAAPKVVPFSQADADEDQAF
jgi:O-glycosyl hydrolase